MSCTQFQSLIAFKRLIVITEHSPGPLLFLLAITHSLVCLLTKNHNAKHYFCVLNLLSFKLLKAVLVLSVRSGDSI